VIAGWFFNGLAQWLLAEFLVKALTWVWGLLAQTAFSTPDVPGFPQVKVISGRSAVIANSCYLLVITTAGIIIMTRETVQSRYGIAELAPRLVIGLVAANMATPICTTLISLGNALTTALTGDPIAGPHAVAQMDQVVTGALPPGAGGLTGQPNSMLLLVIGLVILVLAASLLASWVVRIGVLVVLVGVAPAALACHGLPQLEGTAKLWWRSVLATLGVVVLQAVGLHVALSVFLDPGANVGLPKDSTGVFNLFIVACLLWAVVKIPSLMRRYVTSGGRGNIAGSLIRVVLVQQLTRWLTRGLAGRTPRAAATATAAGYRTTSVAAGRSPRPLSARPTTPTFSHPEGQQPLPRPAGTRGAPTFSNAPTPAAPRRAPSGRTVPAAGFSDTGRAQPPPPPPGPATPTFSARPAPGTPTPARPGPAPTPTFSDAPRPHSAPRRAVPPAAPTFQAPPRRAARPAPTPRRRPDGSED
jgi:hypothetical protein